MNCVNSFDDIRYFFINFFKHNSSLPDSSIFSEGLSSLAVITNSVKVITSLVFWLNLRVSLGRVVVGFSRLSSAGFHLQNVRMLSFSNKFIYIPFFSSALAGRVVLSSGVANREKVTVELNKWFYYLVDRLFSLDFVDHLFRLNDWFLFNKELRDTKITNHHRYYRLDRRLDYLFLF